MVHNCQCRHSRLCFYGIWQWLYDHPNSVRWHHWLSRYLCFHLCCTKQLCLRAWGVPKERTLTWPWIQLFSGLKIVGLKITKTIERAFWENKFVKIWQFKYFSFDSTVTWSPIQIALKWLCRWWLSPWFSQDPSKPNLVSAWSSLIMCYDPGAHQQV